MAIIDFGPGIRARTAPSDGEKVLWVHGYTITSDLWPDLWAHLPGWHHIGPDLPGHGASEPMGPNETLRTLGRRLADEALAHGVRHVVGLSLGSMIALQVVLEHPRAFATLTMGAPAMGGGPVEADVGNLYRELWRLYNQMGPGPWMTALWTTSPPNLFAYAEEHPRLWKRLVDVINKHAWGELPDFRMSRFVDYTQSLVDVAKIESRVLLLVGEYEMPAFKETAGLIQAAAPHSRIIYLPGTGHLCMLESNESSAHHIDAHLRGAGSSIVVAARCRRG